ncbi:MAG: NAD(P)-dependent oxidoreductase [Patescibacteria group bacterium]
MKLAFFELEGWEEKTLRDRFPHEELLLIKDRLDEFHLPPQTDAEVISGFVDSRVTEKVLSNFPALRCITTRSTGYDHIDVAECKKRGIVVCFVPGYGNNTVAEFAFGLILNLTRKIYHAIDQIKETGSFSLQGFRGIDLKGKVLGVVGTGRIGKESVRIGRGFGMKVVAFDPRPDAPFAAETGMTYLSLHELLACSDVITIHCPLTPETTHLLNRDNIKTVKRGAYLVNTARGPIVETAALIDALDQGILAGVAVDVLEEEGEIKDEMKFLSQARRPEELVLMLQNHMLMRMPNVLITPHIAFNSREALMRILETTMESINGFLAGKPAHVVPELR